MAANVEIEKAENKTKNVEDEIKLVPKLEKKDNSLIEN